MLKHEIQNTIDQLRSICTDENRGIIYNAIGCIKELSSTNEALLDTFEDCGNRLREAIIEIQKLKNL